MSIGLAVVLITGAFLAGAILGFVCTAIILMSNKEDDNKWT